ERRPPLAELIVGLDRDALAALILDLDARVPRLAEQIEQLLLRRPAAPAAPAASPAPPAPRRTPVDVAAFRRQVQSAFRGYSYGDYYAAGSIVSSMDTLVGQIRPFIEGGDPESALPLLEVLTAEFSAGWTDYDDSDGELGGFLDELGPLWAEALLSADLPAAERAAWRERLEQWDAESSDYGVDGMGLALCAAEEGWSAPMLVQAMRGELAQWDLSNDYNERRLLPIRLRVLEQKGLLAEAINLAAATGQHREQALTLLRVGRIDDAVALARSRLRTATDALALATAMRTIGHVSQALDVAEIGLDLEEPRAGLGAWLIDLALAAGRDELALRGAETAFRSAPSLPLYLRLRELTEAAWPAQREQMLTFLRAGKGLWNVAHAAVDIFLHEGLIDDAITTVQQSAGSGDLMRVIDAAIQERPEWAVQASQRQAEGIMESGKAQHYDSAIEWLRRTRAGFAASGRPDLWQAYLLSLRAQHRRKHKLMGLFALLER
ncbi:MAG: hypothetical protein HGB28_01560, partial [Oscillochloris sp.]|nr:hypothetical protein [Oscillochloris sp.]